MTLGPDRKTRLRWMSEPFLTTDDKSGGAAGGGDGKTDDQNDNGSAGKANNDQNDSTRTAGKDGKTGADGDGKPGKSVVVEIEGRKYVLQDHVNELVGGARTEGETRGKQAAAEEAARIALEQQGDFKALYETEKQKREEAETAAEQLRLTALRRTIGAKHGLSERLSDRLQGKTEKEIDADAKELAAEQKTDGGDRKAPTTENGTGSRTRQRDSGSGNKSDASKDDKTKPRRLFAFQSEGDVARW